MDIIIENIDTYLDGLLLTIELTTISVILGFCLASLLVWMHFQHTIIATFANAFIYFFRGTPLLIQLYLIYYGVGQLSFVKDTLLWDFFKEPYFCAVLALMCNNAAYSAEIFRSAIVNTSHVEKEAAIAYGMSATQMYLFVIIPSSIRRAMPAYSNEVIFMLHATSLASVITLIELTGAARIVNTNYYSPFEAFIAAAVLYMAITFSLVGVFKLIENKINRHLSF